MKKYALTAVLLLTAISFPAAAETTAASWETAVEHFSSGEKLRPHSMEVFSKTYNGKGELEKTQQIMLRLSYDIHGQMESELIASFEDGKDVTEQKKKERRGNSGGGPPGGDSEGFDRNPFDPSLQGEVEAIDTGLIQYKNAQRCSVWKFRLKLNDKHDAVGSAWISLNTGAAVSLEYQLEPNYPFVDEMDITMNYMIDDSGYSLLDEVRFKGRINMIIMKKNIDSTTSFYDYR